MPAPFEVLYADPSWDYKSRCAWSEHRFGGGTHRWYPTMKTADLCRLPVAELAAARSVCLMWATFPKLPDALKVMAAWGFRYSTVAFVWVKMNQPRLVRTWHGQKLTQLVPLAPTPWGGPGYYTRSNAEIVLLGTRGQPLAPASKAVQQVILEPHPREWRVNKHGKRFSAIVHSKKPDTVRHRIEALFGERSRVELFARERAPGWEAIGNQLADNPIELKPVEPTQPGAGRAFAAKKGRKVVEPVGPAVIPGQISMFPELVGHAL